MPPSADAAREGDGAGEVPGAGVEGLLVEQDGPVLRLTLDRPDKRNALSDTMVAGLIDAVEAAGQDEAVRAVVLAGRGDHFCGGADIVARNASGGRTRSRVGSIQRRLPAQAHRLIPLLLSVQVPVICRVQGWAAGIGCQLALAADFTVAAHDASLWEPFSERGFTPDSGATWLLPRLAGVARARRMLLLGEAVSGAEAADWGLVHESVDGGDSGSLDAAVATLADRLAAGPTVALGLTKWLLLAGATEGLGDHLQNEALALELSSRSEDFKEGFTAFREKRGPEFTGR